MFPTNYSSETQYLRNKSIVEYDMESAGYHVTISEKLIKDKSILKLLAVSNKKERQIILGNYAKKHKDFSKQLNAGFKKYIARFCNENSIPKEKVLFVKKDAIIFFDCKITKTNFSKVTFSKRAEFTSFMQLNKIEMYYNSFDDSYSVKGISIETIEDTLIEEIFKIMKFAEYNSPSKVAVKLAELRKAYVNRELVDEYYRELGPSRSFQLFDSVTDDTTTYCNISLSQDEEFFEDVNIIYNYKHILMPLFKVLI